MRQTIDLGLRLDGIECAANNEARVQLVQLAEGSTIGGHVPMHVGRDLGVLLGERVLVGIAHACADCGGDCVESMPSEDGPVCIHCVEARLLSADGRFEKADRELGRAILDLEFQTGLVRGLTSSEKAMSKALAAARSECAEWLALLPSEGGVESRESLANRLSDANLTIERLAAELRHELSQAARSAA